MITQRLPHGNLLITDFYSPRIAENSADVLHYAVCVTRSRLTMGRLCPKISSKPALTQDLQDFQPKAWDQRRPASTERTE